MKNVFLLGLLALAACSATKPIDPPGQVPPGAAQAPGDRAPASTSDSWTTQGGPASPGSPSQGTTITSGTMEAKDGGTK
jgi:hypothetical protein